jgi:hypothetical protein
VTAELDLPTVDVPTDLAAVIGLRTETGGKGGTAGITAGAVVRVGGLIGTGGVLTATGGGVTCKGGESGAGGGASGAGGGARGAAGGARGAGGGARGAGGGVSGTVGIEGADVANPTRPSAASVPATTPPNASAAITAIATRGRLPRFATDFS